MGESERITISVRVRKGKKRREEFLAFRLYRFTLSHRSYKEKGASER